MPRCEDFLMFQEQTSSPSSVCAGGLVEIKLLTRCPTLHCMMMGM